jgi:hypothetical protein
MTKRVAGLLLAMGVAAAAPLGAQAGTADDVATLDGIVGALYASISGPAGDRDWDRFLALFLPGATLLNAGPRPDTAPAPAPVSPAGYQERSAPFFRENPFYEVEVARTTHRYGAVAQLWSTYESRRDPSLEPFSRGINSIVVVRHAGRWWIATIIWDYERPDNPIPGAYLPMTGA